MPSATPRFIVQINIYLILTYRAAARKLVEAFECKACKRSFKSKDGLNQHNRTKHKARGLTVISLYSLIAIGLTAFLAYSGVLGWLSQAVGPTSARESPNLGKEVIIHVHPRLEISIDGKLVTVPANIGIDPKLWKDRSLERYGMPMSDMREMPYMSPLHTHDTSGTIHIESTVIREYTLGQFFDVWGVRFSESCIFDRCSDGKSNVVMFVNRVRNYDFRSHILKDGEQIRIEFRIG